MDEIVKHINDTNASYRTIGSGDAKNTDLFLDNEHYELFSKSGESITVRFEKENLQKAILFIASILPRKYDNSSVHKTILFSQDFVLEQLAILQGFFTVDGRSVSHRTQIWTARKDVPKKNGKLDARFYFNGLLEDIVYRTKDGSIRKAKFTVRNYLAGGYSDIHFRKAEDDVYDVWITNVLSPFNDGKEDNLEIDDKPKDISLQQIFYGAPGTGKSHKINEVTEKQPQDNVFRTTFHPDSDYSTFVGCYKPISKKGREQAILDYDSLVDRFKKYISDLGNITHASAAIGYNYHDSIVKMQENSKHTISDLLADAHKSGTTYDTTIRSGMLLYEEQMRLGGNSGKISYEFVPQAFTKAYIKAWQTTEPIFLVIEEINRGNCAQIFGDLFQLLDRKNGVSEYPIKPDTDLGSFIAEKMETPVEGAPESVVRGEEMILPSNLYIWATMNTSDQSLFPIDSAFKRRWDWVYVPSEDAEKGWKIQVNSHEYDWYTFLKSINNEVFDLTHSEDKQLGYFFAKAIDGVIDAKTLVNKVYFYLWTDVFKDYEYESLKAFRKPDGNSAIAFKNFFNKAGIDEVMAEQVLINLGLDNPAETVE